MLNRRNLRPALRPSLSRRKVAYDASDPYFENRAVRRPTDENIGQWDGGIRDGAFDFEAPREASWGADSRDPITRHAKRKAILAKREELAMKRAVEARMSVEKKAAVALKIARHILGSKADDKEVIKQSADLMHLSSEALESTLDRISTKDSSPVKVNEPAKDEPAKSEPAKVEATVAEPAKVEASAEPVKTAEPAKPAEPVKEPVKAETKEAAAEVKAEVKVEAKKVAPKKAKTIKADEEKDPIGEFLSDGDVEDSLGDVMDDEEGAESEDVDEALGDAETSIDDIEESMDEAGAGDVIETKVPEKIPAEMAEASGNFFDEVMESLADFADEAAPKEASKKKKVASKIGGPIRKSEVANRSSADGLFELYPDVSHLFQRKKF
ncbi:MAG: hypothetical protein WC783_00995 [Candidatus Paceibacterota bacterium]|jgi:hypothetical protein